MIQKTENLKRVKTKRHTYGGEVRTDRNVAKNTTLKTFKSIEKENIQTPVKQNERGTYMAARSMLS